ncbi:MAG: hypothetical protein OSB10_07060, partial [Planctomycetota bacterium]|nr:hypothetical protein [Planctomycetota bacterium]
ELDVGVRSGLVLDQDKLRPLLPPNVKPDQQSLGGAPEAPPGFPGIFPGPTPGKPEGDEPDDGE